MLFRSYYQDTTIKKGDNACLQGCYNKVRRLLVDGRLVAIDLTNAHIEIIKNLARIMEMEPKSYEILDYYCSNRKQILNDIMLVYDCDREVAKNYFIIILFGGSYDRWITNNDLGTKQYKKTEFMIKFETAYDFIKIELNKHDFMNGFKAFEKQVNKKNDWKIERSSIALLLQEIESKILVVKYNYLSLKSCITRICIHEIGRAHV